MKKLFFIAALLMAAEIVVLAENNKPTKARTWSEWWDQTKQGAKVRYNRAKQHLRNNWKQYAAGAAVVGLGSAAYLNRDRLGSYWTGGSERAKRDLENKKMLQSKEDLRNLNEDFEKEYMDYGERQSKETKERFDELSFTVSKKPSRVIGEGIKKTLFGIPPKTFKQYKDEERNFLENQKKMREQNKQYTYRAAKERQLQRTKDIKSGKNLNTQDNGSDYLFRNEQKRKRFIINKMTPAEREHYEERYKYYGEDPYHQYVPYSPSAAWHDTKTFFRAQPRN